jgi:hypothetical protein
VGEIAGRPFVDEVAAHIKNSIRKTEDWPRNQAVRKKARLMASRAGYPPDVSLNAA